MLAVMNIKLKVALLIAATAILAGIAALGGGGHHTTSAVPPAGLRVADQFAADFTSPNGIDSNNRISDGLDATAAVSDGIAKSLQDNNARGAGFTVTGPAVDSGTTPLNVIVPTDHGPWRIQVTDYNGRWLVSRA